MAIYVGENNALMLKSDRSVVEFYKGDTKIFGYNNSAQGEIITADNVHPIEHKLKVKLSSDTITDFSGVTVTRCGKNLFNINNLFLGSNLKNLIISGNEFSFEKTLANTSGSAIYDIYLKVGTYRFSGSAVSSNGKDLIGIAIRKAGSSTFIINNSSAGSDKGCNFKFTLPESTVYRIGFYSQYGAEAGTVTTFKNIQLEYGSIPTDYEQYKGCQTVKANTDGTVEGLTSLSPDMTVLSDSTDTAINVSYC